MWLWHFNSVQLCGRLDDCNRTNINGDAARLPVHNVKLSLLPCVTLMFTPGLRDLTVFELNTCSTSRVCCLAGSSLNLDLFCFRLYKGMCLYNFLRQRPTQHSCMTCVIPRRPIYPNLFCWQLSPFQHHNTAEVLVPNTWTMHATYGKFDGEN